MLTAIRSLGGVLAALLFIAAILGPLGVEVITFHVSESARSQYLGGESITVFAALVLTWFALRPTRIAVTLLPGACLYLIYTFTTVVMGQSYSQYAGANAEYAFPLYTVITALSALTLTLSLFQQDVPQPGPKAITATRWFLSILGLLFGTLWALQIVEYHSGQNTAVHDADPALFWLIKFLDYSFLIPAFFFVALTLPHSAAAVGARMLVVFAVFLAAAITGMGIAQALAGESGAWGVVGFMAMITSTAGIATTPWVRAAAVAPLEA